MSLIAVRPAPIPPHPRYGPWWVFSCAHGGNPLFGPPRLIVRLRHRVVVEGLQSCGCLRSTTHGETVGVAQGGHVPTEYSVWAKMRHRYSPDVCDAWQDYATFLRDVGRCPDGWWLLRADPGLPWRPENAQWVERQPWNWQQDTDCRFLLEVARELGIA